MKKFIAFLMCIFLLTACTPQTKPQPSATVPTATVPSATITPSAALPPTATPAITQTVEPTPTATPSNVLEKGMENERVAKLQERLISLGYLHISEPSAYFGSATKKAVKAFQKQNGLKETGIADEKTQDVLYSDDAKKCALPLAGYVIGIDPGHQTHSNKEQEPIAPGSSETKKKVSSGTQGKWTRVNEYEVNLIVGLMLRDLLEEQGATVVMTRETNDVDISNIERAKFFNEKKTDYALRLHCNGSDNPDKKGAFMLVPKKNPYLKECNRAAEILIHAYCKETGAPNLGITVRSDQTGFNWCDRMIINIEMGHMSNKEEDYLLADAAYQKKMAKGLCNGIVQYFEQLS